MVQVQPTEPGGEQEHISVHGQAAQISRLMHVCCRSGFGSQDYSGTSPPLRQQLFTCPVRVYLCFSDVLVSQLLSIDIPLGSVL